MKKPHNILILCSDEHAPQVMGCAGDPLVRTPNMDRLAKRGVNFTNAYCANPVCVPGRYSKMTGQLPREIGSLCYGEGMDPKTWTYPKHFSAAGWQTTCVGKQHFMGTEQMHGWMYRPYGDMELTNGFRKMPLYDAEKDPYPGRPDAPNSTKHWVENAGPSNKGFMIFDESVTRETGIFIDDFYNHSILPVYNSQRPLLLEVSWKTPHLPFFAPEDLYEYYRERITMPKFPMIEGETQVETDKFEPDKDVTSEQILNARAAYWGLVEYTDQQIGKVLDFLETEGTLDDFIIIYISDHGEFAGERGRWGKSLGYEWSSRVPFIVSGPGIPEGKTISENVSLMDIYPTICEYAGLEIPEGLRGDSLKPLIDAEEAPEEFKERIVFSERFEKSSMEASWVMAKKSDMKYIYYRGGNKVELFDLAKDIDELENLTGDKEYAEIETELREAVLTLPDPFRWDENPDHLIPEHMIR